RHTIWPRDWSSDVCSSDLNFAPHAGLRHLLAAKFRIGQHADRGVGLRLDLRLAATLPAKPAVREPPAALDELEELRFGGAADRILLAPLERGGEQRRLNLVERPGYRGRSALQWDRRLPAGPSCQHDLAARQVPRADLQPHGYAKSFPFEVLRPGLHRVAEVELDAQAGFFQIGLHLRPDT